MKHIKKFENFNLDSEFEVQDRYEDDIQNEFDEDELYYNGELQNEFDEEDIEYDEDDDFNDDFDDEDDEYRYENEFDAQNDEEYGIGNGHVHSFDDFEVSEGLTAKQKKLPKALQDAILKKNKKSKTKEDKKDCCGHCDGKHKEEKESKGLTAKQKKLPKALQDAILRRKK
jgi:DNA-directed RNA polymerase subunit delta